jgi:arginine-glutamic acid dipeptide repeat-containing protein
VKDVEALRDFSSQPDTFFYILSYNPENNRLASIQGEIRIGGSHQARLPPLRSAMTPDDADRDSPVWIPGRMRDSDLTMFLRAARSMAAFAGICAGSQDDGIRLAANDRTTIDAYDSVGHLSMKQVTELLKVARQRVSNGRFSQPFD